MSKKNIGIALLIAVVTAGCSESEEPMSQGIVTNVTASVMEVKDQSVPEQYITSGTITTDHRVSISSRLSGYIKQLTVREGDRVEAGQVVVRVDPVDAKQALVQAQADLANAQADMNRFEELLKAGAVTKQQAAKVKLRYQVAKSQVEQARNQLSYAEVRSPVDGVVVEKRLSQGDLAAPGGTILIVEDPSSLLLETNVSEQFVQHIQVNDEVDVDVSAVKRVFTGVVRQVVKAADPVTHQFLVKVALPVNDLVHPGMYAQAGFHVGARAAILIPTEVVIDRSGLNAVYVVDEQGISHYRQIRLGNVHGDQVEVLSGLHQGDRIAWGSDQSLKSGMKVNARSQAQ